MEKALCRDLALAVVLPPTRPEAALPVLLAARNRVEEERHGTLHSADRLLADSEHQRLAQNCSGVRFLDLDEPPPARALRCPKTLSEPLANIMRGDSSAKAEARTSYLRRRRSLILTTPQRNSLA